MAESALSRLGLEGAELSLLITGDRRMRALNRVYRGMDRTTDVLSFSMYEPGGAVGKKAGRKASGAPPVVLGDVVISAPRALAQAREAGHTLTDELRTLLVHGVLHLIGYDHEDSGDRRRMMRRQRELIKHLKAR